MKKEDREKLKRSLPKGFREIIASRTNLSIVTVDKVLAGERENIKVIKEAIALAKTHKEELENMAKEIKKL